MKLLSQFKANIAVPEGTWKYETQFQPTKEMAKPDFSELELIDVPGTIKRREIKQSERVELEVPAEQIVKTKPLKQVQSLRGLFEL